MDLTQAQEEEVMLAKEAQTSFSTFCELVFPGYQTNWHHEEIAKKLEEAYKKVQNNEKVRIILSVPPRHGKSLMASQLFPAWCLGKDPTMPFMVTSYSSDLAETFGQKTKDIIASDEYKFIFPGIKIRQDTKAKGNWALTKGGSYLAVGVGGGITGKGAKFAIIDDPIKNKEESESATVRNKIWDWYTSTLYTRLEGYGAVIVILTRWHTDDLAGRLIEQMEKGKGDEWDVIEFPAVAMGDEYIEDRLVRKENEPLWRSKYNMANLMNIKATIGRCDWSSLYQQKPVLAEDQEFKEGFFKVYDPAILENKRLRYYTFVDPAISQKKQADNTVVITVAKDPNTPYIYRIREDAGKYTPTQTVDIIFKHYEEYHSKITIETTAYQAALKFAVEEEQVAREIYFKVHEFKPKAEKELRIRGLIPMYERGIIYGLPDDKKFIDEAFVFPKGKHDDRLDSMSSVVQSILNTKRHLLTRVIKPHWTGYGRLKGR